MKNNLLIIAIFIFAIKSYSQDISGEWIGNLSQISGGISYNYAFLADFSQNNNQISGFSVISLYDNPQIYGKISLTGSFNNNILNFLEQDVISENKGRNNFVWCIKTGKLKYTETQDSAILSGKWTGIKPISCSPGTIRLAKLLPQNQQVDNQVVIPVDNSQQTTNNNIDLNRQLKQGQTIDIPSVDITIIVSEAAKEDNDTLSIIFNDTPILVKHRLTKAPYQLSVQCVDNQQNKLVMYAHNLGDIPPNTAKIQIISGNLHSTIILTSDIDESDVIYLNVK